MYRKEYYEKNKEKFHQQMKEYRDKNIDKLKKYQKKYFQENKEQIYEKQKEWRSNNKEKWIKSLADSRKRRIERLKEEGVTNPWAVVTKGSKPKYKKEI